MTMEPEQEVLELARELRDTIETRFSAMERRIQRAENGRPGGFVPDDQDYDDEPGGDLDGRRRAPARTGLELAARDSYAGWIARQQGVPQVAPGEFSIGRLIQCMWGGDRANLNEIERQALTEGTDSAGGVLIGGAQAGAVIDLVRPRVAVLAAGAVVVPMTAESLVYPKVLTGATPQWLAELATMPESNLTFGSLTLQAKTLRTKVKISDELRDDMTPEGADAISRELTAAFAYELDRVALLGSGTGAEPRGVKNTAGVNSITAVGTPTNYGFLAQAIAAVRAANHEPTAAIVSATTAGTLDQLAATDNQPLNPPPSVAGLPNGVIATSLVSGDAFVAEWPLLVIGVRPQLGVRIRTIEASLADDFSVEIVASQRADIGLIDPAGFAVASGITPGAVLEVTKVEEKTEAKKAAKS
jgi:HK97 family phage major capsid protein